MQRPRLWERGRLVKRLVHFSVRKCGRLAQRNLTSGEGGIRTHGTREGTIAFKAITFVHSVTSP